MARQSISFTKPNDEWLKNQVESKEYSSKSELINDLIRQARKQQVEIDWIRTKLETAENSVMDQVFYQRAFIALNHLDMAARSEALGAFSNLEFYAQVRREVSSINEAYNPLSLIVNSLHNGVSTKILQAGVKEKQQVWRILQELIASLKEKPVKVSLNRRRIHILEYFEVKLGPLPDDSKEITIQELADYVSQLLQLLSFQYHKWQSQVALVMTRFETQNDISPVNLLN